MGNCGGIKDPPPNPNAVDLTHFELLKVVGKGGFGKVNAITALSSQELLALKRMEKSRVLKSKTHLTMVWTERKIMSIVTSPFLCRLRHAFESDTELFLVMPFLQGGDLRFHLRERGRMSESTARFYAAEMLLGLQDLHSKRIVYRDLKPENLLLDDQGHLQITDFGLAFFLQPEDGMRTRGQAGTRGYMAPETLSLSGYGLSVDFFSFGVVLYELLHGRRPWRSIDATMAMMGMEGESDPLAAARLRQDEPQQQHREPTTADGRASRRAAEGGDGDGGEEDEDEEAAEELRFSSRLSAEARSLLLGLLEFSPAKRLGAAGGWAEVKRQPFFSALDWTAMESRSVKPPFTPDVTHANCTPDADLADQLLDKKPKRIRDEEQKAFRGWSWNTAIATAALQPSAATVSKPATAADEPVDSQGRSSTWQSAAHDKAEAERAEVRTSAAAQSEAAAAGRREKQPEEEKQRDNDTAPLTPVTAIAMEDAQQQQEEQRVGAGGEGGSGGGSNSSRQRQQAAKAGQSSVTPGLLSPPTAFSVSLAASSAAAGLPSLPPSLSCLPTASSLPVMSSSRASLTSSVDHRKSISAGALSLHAKEEKEEPQPAGGRSSLLLLSPHSSSSLPSPSGQALRTALSAAAASASSSAVSDAAEAHKEGKERRSTMRELKPITPVAVAAGGGEHARTSSTPAVFPVG